MGTRKNVGRQILDTINRATTKLGVVKGLYSDSYEPVFSQEAATSSGWYFFKFQSENLPSLATSYQYLVKENLSPEILPIGDNNKANLGATVIGEDANNVLMLVAGVEVPRAVETSITIECENSEIALYVNNQKIVESYDAIRNRRIFLGDTARNSIHVIIRRRKLGGTKTIHFKGFIQLDPTIPVIFSPLVPGEPAWLETGEIYYGSLSGTEGTTGIILSWYDNPFCAGWNIERLSYRGLGPVISYVNSGTLNSGTLRYTFLVSGSYVPGNVFAVWGDNLLGLITNSTAVGYNTDITVAPVEDPPFVNPSGKLAAGALFYEFTSASIVAEVDRRHIVDLGATVQYVDTSVIEGMPYSYRIAGQAIFNPSIIGPFSTLRTDNAYDDGPPGPIVLWPNSIDAVSSIGPLVTVKHTYPTDPDLAGYRIYVASGGRTKESYTGGEKPRLLVDLGLGSSLLRLNFTPSGVNPASLPSRYGEFDFYAREIKNVNANLIIDGYICTTYDYAGNELSIPSGTDFSVTFLVLPPENFTSFDNLVSPALGQRRPDGIPEHMWLTALDLKIGQEASVESL
jgi:hypothetical protein